MSKKNQSIIIPSPYEYTRQSIRESFWVKPHNQSTLHALAEAGRAGLPFDARRVEAIGQSALVHIADLRADVYRTIQNTTHLIQNNDRILQHATYEEFCVDDDIYRIHHEHPPHWIMKMLRALLLRIYHALHCFLRHKLNKSSSSSNSDIQSSSL